LPIKRRESRVNTCIPSERHCSSVAGLSLYWEMLPITSRFFAKTVPIESNRTRVFNDDFVIRTGLRYLGVDAGTHPGCDTPAALHLPGHLHSFCSVLVIGLVLALTRLVIISKCWPCIRLDLGCVGLLTTIWSPLSPLHPLIYHPHAWIGGWLLQYHSGRYLCPLLIDQIVSDTSKRRGMN
jgi:hypothetical protein